MKRRWSILFSVCLALALCACGARGAAVVSTSSAEQPFSIAEAEALIRPYDEAAAWLGAQDTVTREQAEALIAAVDEAFPGEGENMLGMFIDIARWEEDERQEFDVIPHSFCPTMFHEGVEVTDAVVRTECSEYDDGSVWETTRLEVTETYTGENEALADWSRTYVFDQTEDGWRFFTFDGQMNFSGEEWETSAPPLKSPVEGP